MSWIHFNKKGFSNSSQVNQGKTFNLQKFQLNLCKYIFIHPITLGGKKKRTKLKLDLDHNQAKPFTVTRKGRSSHFKQTMKTMIKTYLWFSI